MPNKQNESEFLEMADKRGCENLWRMFYSLLCKFYESKLSVDSSDVKKNMLNFIFITEFLDLIAFFFDKFLLNAVLYDYDLL